VFIVGSNITCKRPDSSLGSPKSKVSLYDDFEPSYLTRSNLHDDIPLLNLERDNDHSVALSPNLVPKPNSPRDVIEDVLVFSNPPSPFNHSCEFEEGDEFENPSELFMSITTEVEHHES